MGHSRGAILGDVIANILLFNKHKVSREYYVNDYGNQIINFTKSVYLRIREILFKEKFPLDDEYLYPGDYLIDFANNIVSSNPDLNFDDNNIKATVTESAKKYHDARCAYLKLMSDFQYQDSGCSPSPAC